MQSSLSTISIIHHTDYAILKLQRGKANVINQQMVDEIRSAIKALEAHDQVKGLIITGHPGFFSAGLDVKELYRYDKDQIKTFLHDFGSMHNELLRFSKPMIAAINGHCPAGGTVIVIAADYRVMVEGEHYTIGLNEMQVNIQVTDILIKGYNFWIGQSKANEYLLEGKLATPSEALSVGLINAVVPESQLMQRAEQQMQQYLSADQDIFRLTKAKIRQDWLATIKDDDLSELDQALEIWWKPEVREKMGLFVQMLEARSQNNK
jgi:3,2-trans-enoyl-CoA isomerase